jgi:hypothetical protein
MNKVQYMNVKSVTVDGVEVEFICRDSNGKTRRPRVFLDTGDFVSLLFTAKSLRLQQRRIAATMTERAGTLTTSGLAE